MIGRRRKDTVPETIETIVGPTASFMGDLKSDGGVRVQGVMEGALETAGNLVVEEKARIIANVIAHNISVAGAIRGDVIANRVEVLSTGRIWGDISANSLLVDEGGFIHGQVNMPGEDLEPPRPLSAVVEAEER